jgi:glutathione peroxidase-family protein
MKSIKVLAIIGTILLSTVAASAQRSAKRTGVVPENGYWVVVSNVATPRVATIKFYDLENHPIYEELITGVRIDVSKKKVCRRLNQSLQSALVAWQENKELLKNKGLVAARFGAWVAPAQPAMTHR